MKDKLVVVADFGGTRSDVAVIASRGGMYTFLSTVHEYELGGAQLDQVLIDHFAKEFIKKHKEDPRTNARSLAKLKMESEATKKALSLGTNATISIESLANGIDFGSTVNRTRYELLAGKVFRSFTALIEQAIQKAELDVLDIDEVRINISKFIRLANDPLTCNRLFCLVEHPTLPKSLALSRPSSPNPLPSWRRPLHPLRSTPLTLPRVAPLSKLP